MKTTATLVALLLFAMIGWKSAKAATSEENRNERTVLLEWTPIGLHPSTLLVSPALGGSGMVGLGVYLGKNWLIGVEYGANNYKFTSSSTESNTATVGTVTGTNTTNVDIDATGNFTNMGASVRWFPGTNSFNVGLALNQRNWDVNLLGNVTDTVTGRDSVTGLRSTAMASVPLNVKLQSEATVASLILGNQWMTDFGMVIGLDWVVLSAATSSSTKSSVNQDAYNLLSPSDKVTFDKSLKDAEDFLNLASGFPGLLVLSFGFAF
jgi:hypothetical protein